MGRASEAKAADVAKWTGSKKKFSILGLQNLEWGAAPPDPHSSLNVVRTNQLQVKRTGFDMWLESRSGVQNGCHRGSTLNVF